MNIINDITNLFNSAPFHPPFVLYDQDELLEDVDRKIAIAFTALNDNFNDILEAQIIQQPLENGEFRACDNNLLPRIVEFEAFFVPPPSDMLTYLSNMDEVQNKVEEYWRNKRTVVIKQNYPLNHLYTNLKIVKAHKVVNQNNWVGDAEGEFFDTHLYPVGTEFLHTVRYIGVGKDGKIGVSTRMK